MMPAGLGVPEWSIYILLKCETNPVLIIIIIIRGEGKVQFFKHLTSWHWYEEKAAEMEL